MSQQSIRFLSSETETYGKQQPACSWPRLSSDLFKEAIHAFSLRRGLPGEASGPSTETCLWVFCLSRSLERSQDTARTMKLQSCSLCPPPRLSRSSQFDKLTLFFFFFSLGEVRIFMQGYPRKSKIHKQSSNYKSEDSHLKPTKKEDSCLWWVFLQNLPSTEGIWDLL